MERALKYLRLLSDALNVRILTDPRGARALIKGTAAEAPQLRHTEICIVFELMQFLKSVTEGRFVPQRITLHCSQRAPQAEYDKIFGCPISFGADESELWFDAEILAYRSTRRDTALLNLHDELAEPPLPTRHPPPLLE